MDARLHVPMYLLLWQLSLMDLLLTSVITPKAILDYLLKDNTISFGGCAFQMFLALTLGSAEDLLLSFMAYDRYVAICHPLNYTILMSQKVCCLMIATSWSLASLSALGYSMYTMQYPFCKSRQIRHLFCEIPPLLKLACADTSANEMVIFVNIGVVASGCFLLISLSYVSIVCSILRIRTSEGRHRAFQTCASHCIVVLCFFVPCVFIYLRPGSRDAVDGVVTVFYTVLTPLLNPVVYTLRNKEVKKALVKLKDKVAYSQSQ